MQSSGEPRGVARLLPKVARALERSSARATGWRRFPAATLLRFLRFCGNARDYVNHYALRQVESSVSGANS